MASDLNSVLKKYLATLGKNEASAAEVAKTVRKRDGSWVAWWVVGAQREVVVRNAKFKVEGV